MCMVPLLQDSFTVTPKTHAELTVLYISKQLISSKMHSNSTSSLAGSNS